MFAIVAAIDAKRGIARQGMLPWQLKLDRQFFQALTCSSNAEIMQRGFQVEYMMTGGMQHSGNNPKHPNVVIMGRETWESLPAAFRPLPHRHNVILSRRYRCTPHQDVSLSRSLPEALEITDRKSPPFTFVIGGAEVFTEALQHPQCRKIFLTEILHDFGCDLFMPQLSTAYTETSCTETYQESGVCFRIKILERH